MTDRSLPMVSPLNFLPVAAGISTVAAAILFAEAETMTTPTTITGAFIVIALGAMTLIGYIIRRQFDQNDRRDKQTERLIGCFEAIVRKMPPVSQGAEIRDGEQE